MGMRTRRAAALLLAAPLLVALTACGDGGPEGSDVEATRPDGFEASPAYLAQVIEESTGASFRFEGFITMGQRTDGDFQGVEDVPVVSGEWNGTRSRTVQDAGEFAKALAEADGEEPRVDLDEVDLSIETVTDGDIVYIYALGYAEIADLPMSREPSPMMQLVTDLGDSWGRVDMAALRGDTEANALFSQLNQGQNLDPRFYLELVKDADDVKDLGEDTVDGLAMVGLAADVPLAAMLEAQGIDPATVVPDASPSFDVAEALEAFAIPVGVWIDEDGNIRRLSMDIGKGMAAAAEGLGESLGPMEGFTMGMSIRFSDHGDASIEIDVPDDAGTTDLTEKVRDL